MSKVAEIMQTMDYGPAPESPAEAMAWLQARPIARHFINGSFQEGGTLQPVLNPATGAVLAEVPLARAAEVEAAVAAAQAAFPAWQALGGEARAAHLYALARGLQKRERLFAMVECLNTGKPLREARDIDVPLVARHFYHHAGWAAVLAEEFPGFEAHGICGQIIPWNFPLLMAAWKIAPALAAGNVVVLKPADLTPLSAVLLAEICVETGLPPGVVNVLQGDGETGALLAAHRGVAKLAFTGSTATGRKLRTATAGSGLALTLELGGKSPFIVLEDADLDAAVEGVVDGVWFNQGEVCCAGTRLLVQEGIAPEFTTRLRARMARLITGDPLEKSTDIGAITSVAQRARVQGFIDCAIASGAVLHQNPDPGGNFCAPGFFTETGTAAEIAEEEVFGPIGVLLTFRTPDEALQLAGHSRYGLSASIWSENITRATDLAARVRAGVVWINCTNQLDAGAAFGGRGESGFGREGGREGMREYLRGATPPGDQRNDAPGWSALPGESTAAEGLDVTARHWIGGKFTRADNGLSARIAGGPPVAWGSRKDIRNAVEAAVKATAWPAMSGHQRAQVLWFWAENLDQRRAEFAELTTEAEFNAARSRILRAAAYADKFDGRTAETKAGFLTLQLLEPQGVIGMVCPPEAPLLALADMVAPALAIGNRVVCVPSPAAPQIGARLAQVLAVSDLPAGALNIITGPGDVLAETLAGHEEVNALWYCGSQATSTRVESLSAGNLKPTWTDGGQARDWAAGPGDWLRLASQTKTVWLPYGA